MLTIRGALPFGLKPSFFEKLYRITMEQSSLDSPDAGLQFVSSVKMAQLNLRYAGKETATDVLSFETDQPDSLGDVVICSRLAQAQAVSHSTTLEGEVGLLFVHGLLHLLGHDHERTIELQRMRELQKSILTAADLQAPVYP